MDERDPPWLTFLRFFAVATLIGPIAMVMIVWAIVAIASYAGNHDMVFAVGNRVLLGVLALGVLGLLLDFFVLPILLSDRFRRRGQ